jgi:hypothetical protein
MPKRVSKRKAHCSKASQAAADKQAERKREAKRKAGVPRSPLHAVSALCHGCVLCRGALSVRCRPLHAVSQWVAHCSVQSAGPSVLADSTGRTIIHCPCRECAVPWLCAVPWCVECAVPSAPCRESVDQQGLPCSQMPLAEL